MNAGTERWRMPSGRVGSIDLDQNVDAVEALRAVLRASGTTLAPTSVEASHSTNEKTPEPLHRSEGPTSPKESHQVTMPVSHESSIDVDPVDKLPLGGMRELFARFGSSDVAGQRAFTLRSSAIPGSEHLVVLDSDRGWSVFPTLLQPEPTDASLLLAYSPELTLLATAAAHLNGIRELSTSIGLDTHVDRNCATRQASDDGKVTS